MRRSACSSTLTWRCGASAMIADAWLISVWYMSLANCSAANFQLQLMTHLCTPPITWVPPGQRSQNESRYHLKSPR